MKSLIQFTSVFAVSVLFVMGASSPALAMGNGAAATQFTKSTPPLKQAYLAQNPSPAIIQARIERLSLELSSLKNQLASTQTGAVGQ